MITRSPSTISRELRLYNAVYALPIAELRKELIICLRQSKTIRRPRSDGVGRCGQIPEIVSIHVRPLEMERIFRYTARKNWMRSHCN